MARIRIDIQVPKYMIKNTDITFIVRAIRKYVMEAYSMLQDVALGRAKKPEAAIRTAMSHLFLARVALEVLQQYDRVEAGKLLEELPEEVVRALIGDSSDEEGTDSKGHS